MKKLFRVSTVPISLNVLLKGQLRYLSQYYDLTAISGAGKDLDEVHKREGVKVFPIEMQRQISPMQDLKSLIRLYRYFKKEKPDIVHSITPKAGLLSMIAAKLAGVPIRVHTFTGLIFPYKQGLFQKILILMDKVLCYCATNIYPEGQGVKRDLEQYKITSKPLKMIGHGNVNGLDSNHFDVNLISEETQSNLKQQLNINSDDFVFVFVGRLVTDKGINELIKAFVRLKEYDNNKSVKLLLVGPYEQDLDPIQAETLEQIEQNKDIMAVGFQSDVRPYFAISKALVFPSYREGFPNVVLQALAMGLPAIVSNINGCNEIVVNGYNGQIVEAKEVEGLVLAMQDYLNPNVYQTQQSNARASITKYNQHDLWQQVRLEYQNLLS